MKQVGGYRILEEIGRGATGIVYKAVDSRANRTVAVKAIRSEPARTLDASALDAMRGMRALSHPNIAALYDVLQEKEQIYAVYEYVPGLSLETMLRRLVLPEKPVLLRCFEQVAQALDYADGKGVIHRDIRPSNIIIDANIIDANGAVGPVAAKITDFGISQIASHEMTSSGAMVGTPSYLSPEEIQGTTVDGRSDQFSLAVVIYEVLSGAKPFIADNLPWIFFQICKQPAKPVDEANPSLTQAVSIVLERALAKNPPQRFPCCADFVQALEKALQEIPEWTAAVERPAIAAVLGNAAAALPLKTDGIKRLPSLRRRPPGEEEEEPVKSPRHSPWKLLALMLVLSAVVIALSVLWGQWDWHSVLPGQRPVPGNGAKSQTETAATRGEQAKPQEQQQAVTKPAQPPPDTNPAAGAAKPSKASTGTPAPARQGGNAPVPGETASIDLLSAPPGATMVIDGNKSTACVTPCTMSLPNGRHTAAVELDGYNVARRVFNVPEDNSVVAALSKSAGTLVVTSTPPGAQILIDNKPYGVTPATLHLPAGPHKLVLIDGPMQHEETVEIEGGELQSRSLRWQ